MIARNAIANAAGMVVTVGVQIGLSFGAYRLVGAEQYGLIGFYSTAMTAAAIFDVGLGQAVVREAARRRHLPSSDPGGVRPLTFNFFLLYLVLAILLAGVAAIAAPFIATHWLHPDKLTAGEITRALMLMGLAIAIQRVRGVFQSAMDGVEQQVTTNILLIITNLIRLALGIGALLLLEASAFAFFAGQALASLIETSVFAVVAHRTLPPSDKPARFDPQIVGDAGRFALTNAVAAAVGTALQIADSVIISAALPLAVFGNYSLVSSMCTVIWRLTAPLLNAAYPRLSAYVREEKVDPLKRLILGYSQVSTVLLATATFALVFFGGPMLALVSGHPQVGRDFAVVLGLLAAAYACSGLSRCLHVVQMAEGFPGISLNINLVMGAFYLPLIIWLTPKYGVMVPAICLLLGNGGSFLAFVFTGFRRRIRGLAPTWLKVAVLPQVAAVAVVYAAGWALARTAHIENAIALTGVAVLLSAAAMVAGGFVSPDIRPEVLRRLRAVFGRA